MKYFRLMLVLFMISACASKKLVSGEDRATDKKSGVSLWSSWVKDKEDKFDIELFLSNDSDEVRIVKSQNVHCFRGKTRGKVEMDANRDNLIQLNPGEIYKFVVICRYYKKMMGDYKVSIKKIHNEPEGDAKQKVVGKNINYIIQDSYTN